MAVIELSDAGLFIRTDILPLKLHLLNRERTEFGPLSAGGWREREPTLRILTASNVELSKATIKLHL